MVTQILVNISSGYGLLPDGTKPLPEPMLTYSKYGPVTFIKGQLHQRCTSHQSQKSASICLNKISFKSPRGRWVKSHGIHRACPTSLRVFKSLANMMASQCWWKFNQIQQSFEVGSHSGVQSTFTQWVLHNKTCIKQSLDYVVSQDRWSFKTKRIPDILKTVWSKWNFLCVLIRHFWPYQTGSIVFSGDDNPLTFGRQCSTHNAATQPRMVTMTPLDKHTSNDTRSNKYIVVTWRMSAHVEKFNESTGEITLSSSLEKQEKLLHNQKDCLQ